MTRTLTHTFSLTTATRPWAATLSRMHWGLFALLMAFVALLIVPGLAIADDCPSRGTLDERYCDADGDLLADVPTDSSKWKDPSTLYLSYVPLDDPAVYASAFSDFMTHLKDVTGKRVRYYGAESYAAQVEALRSGRLHVAFVGGSATLHAVNLAGFRPQVAILGQDGTIGYTLQLVVRADSDIHTAQDLKGRKVAHVAPLSTSGDTAPRVLFKEEGIDADDDYEVLYSGKHDNSIMGVVHGDYDAAPVSSVVVNRMIDKGVIKEDDIRIAYESEPFPRGSFGVIHDLDPELQDKILEAFMTFKFEGTSLAEAMPESHSFTQIDYKKDFEIIRAMSEAAEEDASSDKAK